jgi:hypothetical protein
MTPADLELYRRIADESGYRDPNAGNAIRRLVDEVERLTAELRRARLPAAPDPTTLAP